MRGDFDRLRESFPDSYHYCDICNFLDLKDKKYQQEALDTGSCNKGGLSALLRSLCGFELDKSMQVSDWAERPLSEHQILYAAKDAFCLICVWDMLNKK